MMNLNKKVTLCRMQPLPNRKQILLQLKRIKEGIGKPMKMKMKKYRWNSLRKRRKLAAIDPSYLTLLINNLLSNFYNFFLKI